MIFFDNTKIHISKEKYFNKGKSVTSLNPDLFTLISNFYGFNKDLISSLIIKNNKIYFDLKKLRKYLCSYYNLKDDENLLDNIRVIKNKYLNSEYAIFSSNKNENDFNHYKNKLMRTSDNLSKKAKKNLHKRALKEYKEINVRNINRFEKFIQNYDEYKKVDLIMIDFDKLNLCLAYELFLKTWKVDNTGEVFIKNVGILVEYIKQNIHLLSSDFHTRDIRMIDLYKKMVVLEKLAEYEMKQMLNEKTKEDTNNKNLEIEKKSYSFFEYDVKESDDPIRKIVKFSRNEENDEELKLLLKSKINILKSLNFNKIYIGSESFKGYIGFAFNNYVLLDKIYTANKRIAKGSAMFLIKEGDFEKITRMTKSEVIDAIKMGKIDAERIYHSKSFEEKAKKEINKAKTLNYLYTKNYS